MLLQDPDFGNNLQPDDHRPPPPYILPWEKVFNDAMGQTTVEPTDRDNRICSAASCLAGQVREALIFHLGCSVEDPALCHAVACIVAEHMIEQHDFDREAFAAKAGQH
jgi:hypothetical protein